MPEKLNIIYQDEHLIAINKPHGLLVHPSGIAADADQSAMQMLRNQTGKWVYPSHRLDRKTAGVLLFALHTETNSLMQQLFMNQKVEKTYHAVVRGFTPDDGQIEYAITNDKGKLQSAVTNYKTLDRAEIALPSGKFPTSRYSLVEISPLTGRMHQIRKHFAHIFHPIIGDRPHGCNKQNKLFLEHFNLREMLLHAQSLKFMHPVSGIPLVITAQYQAPMLKIVKNFGWVYYMFTSMFVYI